jgi:hypothetical protein
MQILNAYNKMWGTRAMDWINLTKMVEPRLKGDNVVDMDFTTLWARLGDVFEIRTSTSSHSLLCWFSYPFFYGGYTEIFVTPPSDG